MKLGKWVTSKDSGHMCKITRVEHGRVYGFWHGSNVESWVKKNRVRLSTKNEIKEEKRILSDPNAFAPYYDI